MWNLIFFCITKSDFSKAIFKEKYVFIKENKTFWFRVCVLVPVSVSQSEQYWSREWKISWDFGSQNILFNDISTFVGYLISKPYM